MCRMAASNARVQQGATAALESKERSEALAQMHLTKILRAYILQMISGMTLAMPPNNNNMTCARLLLAYRLPYIGLKHFSYK